MPFELSLPQPFLSAQWKVKIREKETCEPPHVTIIRKTTSWRMNLRTGTFLDKEPDPRDLPETLLSHIRGKPQWQMLCKEWDKKYPNNPVTDSQAPEGGDLYDCEK